MDLTAPAIDKIVSLSTPNTPVINGLTYTDKALTLIKTPTSDTLAVNTLAGLVDLLQAGFEGFDPTGVILHVVDHAKVELLSKTADEFGRRKVYVQVTPLKGVLEFKFNTFMDAESFNISLNSQFVQTDALQELVRIAGNIAHEGIAQTGDDGITQTVSVKRGIRIIGESVVNPRRTLAPFRTFREVEQPTSEFLLRVRQDGDEPTCALFEADGGAWRITAVNTVRDWLSNQLKADENSALGEIPIVA